MLYTQSLFTCCVLLSFVELATYLEELQKMLQENFERVRDKEIEANRVNDIVKNRNFKGTADEVAGHLIEATSHFLESEHLETEAQSFFNLANREVNKFISGDVEGRLTTALEWLSNASKMIENTKSENAAIPPLQDRIDVSINNDFCCCCCCLCLGGLLYVNKNDRIYVHEYLININCC